MLLFDIEHGHRKSDLTVAVALRFHHIQSFGKRCGDHFLRAGLADTARYSDQPYLHTAAVIGCDLLQCRFGIVY